MHSFRACNFRVLFELQMVVIHYFPPNVPFGLSGRNVLLLRSVIIKINGLIIEQNLLVSVLNSLFHTVTLPWYLQEIKC